MVRLDTPAPITAIAFAPSGKEVVIAAQDLVEIRSWPELHRVRAMKTKLPHVCDLALSPDGARLALAGGSPGDWGDCEIHERDDPAANVVRCKQKLGDLLVGVAWRADGKQLAAAGADKLAFVFDRELRQIDRFAGHSQPLTSIAWLGAESLLVTASLDQSVRLWNTETAEPVRSLDNHTAAVLAIAVRPRQDDAAAAPWIATGGADRTVRFWQPTIGRLIRFAKLPNPPLALAWSPDGTYVYAATTNGEVVRIDSDTLKLQTLPTKLGGWSYCLGVHPDGESLLVGGERGQIQRVDVE